MQDLQKKTLKTFWGLKGGWRNLARQEVKGGRNGPPGLNNLTPNPPSPGGKRLIGKSWGHSAPTD